MKTVYKIESFACFDNSRFMATELCKARVTVLALSNSGIQFFVLPSVTRECHPKILELLYLLQCRSIS